MRKLGRVRTKTESPKVRQVQNENRILPNVGGSTKRRDSLASIWMAMQERMGAKRQLEVDMYQALTGASRTLQLTHFTRDMLLDTHTMDVGGFEGMIIFNEKQNTFGPDKTTLYRLIMQYAQVPNIWNILQRGGAAAVRPRQAEGPGAPALDRRHSRDASDEAQGRRREPDSHGPQDEVARLHGSW